MSDEGLSGAFYGEIRAHMELLHQLVGDGGTGGAKLKKTEKWVDSTKWSDQEWNSRIALSGKEQL